MIKDNRAFTLAEVLITLGIIGVVAALTIPTLLTEHAKRSTVTQLKKAYSDISQALRLAESEYGSPEGWLEFDEEFEELSSNFINNIFKPNIKIVQDCSGDDSSLCWGDTYTTLAGVKYGVGNSKVYNTFVTINGYSVKYWPGGFVKNTLYVPHYQFIIDINGKSLPNILGKDTFQFTYVPLNNGGWSLIPAGSYGENYLLKDSRELKKYSREELFSDSKNGCSKNVTSTTGGTFCAALIIQDGWKISKDYPWK